MPRQVSKMTSANEIKIQFEDSSPIISAKSATNQMDRLGTILLGARLESVPSGAVATKKVPKVAPEGKVEIIPSDVMVCFLCV